MSLTVQTPLKDIKVEVLNDEPKSNDESIPPLVPYQNLSDHTDRAAVAPANANCFSTARVPSSKILGVDQTVTAVQINRKRKSNDINDEDDNPKDKKGYAQNEVDETIVEDDLD